MLKKSERELIDEVEQRLVCTFAQLPVGAIASAVEDAHMRFQQSVIRDYIPLLVERRVHNELGRLASDPDLSIELAPTA